MFLITVVAFVMLPLLGPTHGSAEWFGDLYGGAAFTQKHDVTLDTSTPIGATTTISDVKFDTAGLIGSRAGYWFQSFSFLGIEPGAGLDVSHVFGPDISSQTRSAEVCAVRCVTISLPVAKFKVDVTEIGFDVMLRYPLLKSQSFPRGQLQPYLTVGPAVFIAHIKDTTNFLPANQSDTDTRIGAKVGAGLAFLITKNIAAFGEYRFSHLDPTFTFKDTILGSSDVSTSINTHAILWGVSYRFP
jgi:opacity protein-like surface antigen